MSRLPSALTAKAVSEGWRAKMLRSGSVPEFHSLAVPSSLDVKTERPLGLNVTELIAPVCPARIATGLPFVSQVRARLSGLPVAIAVPARLNATVDRRSLSVDPAQIPPPCAWKSLSARLWAVCR